MQCFCFTPSHFTLLSCGQRAWPRLVQVRPVTPTQQTAALAAPTSAPGGRSSPTVLGARHRSRPGRFCGANGGREIYSERIGQWTSRPNWRAADKTTCDIEGGLAGKWDIEIHVNTYKTISSQFLLPKFYPLKGHLITNCSFHRIGPLGWFGLVVAMSVYILIYLYVPCPCYFL